MKLIWILKREGDNKYEIALTLLLLLVIFSGKLAIWNEMFENAIMRVEKRWHTIWVTDDDC